LLHDPSVMLGVTCEHDGGHSPKLIDTSPGTRHSDVKDLPDEVWLHVMGFLDLKSLFGLRLSCEWFNRLAEDEQLWKHLYSRFRGTAFVGYSREQALEGIDPQLAKKWTTPRKWPKVKALWQERLKADVQAERFDRAWASGRAPSNINLFMEEKSKDNANEIYVARMDEKYIAAPSPKRGTDQKRSILILDRQTHKLVYTLDGHTQTVYSLQFDDEKLISGSDDQSIRVWNMKTGKPIKTLTEHTDMVWHIHYDDDLNLLASSSFDNTVRLWKLSEVTEDNNSKRPSSIAVLSGHGSQVYHVDFDSQKIYSASADESWKIWDTETKQCVFTKDNAHSSYVFRLQYYGNVMVTCGGDECVLMWDLRHPTKHVRTFAYKNGAVWAMQFDHNLKKLVTANPDQGGRIWDMGMETSVGEFHSKSQTPSAVAMWSLQFNERGEMLTAGKKAQLLLWQFTV
jgi:hypothetical protein